MIDASFTEIDNTLDSDESGKDSLIEIIIRFLDSIGIETKFTELNQETFLPGILIHEGVIYIDIDKLSFPGDLLHEAGHIAVMTKEDRVGITGNVGVGKSDSNAGGEELMAIAWSYAALMHLGLKPEVVFHPGGYKGASQWFIDMYTNGTFIALPTLQWIGLCFDEKQAAINNVRPYPNMVKWLRD